MLRRGSLQLLQSLALGAYAWVGEHPLTWGAGGPERWPGTRPYITPPDQQDQRGFYIFDWYKAIAQAILGKSPDILLLKRWRMKTGIDHDLPLMRYTSMRNPALRSPKGR
jgi:hypothetical protein